MEKIENAPAYCKLTFYLKRILAKSLPKCDLLRCMSWLAALETRVDGGAVSVWDVSANYRLANIQLAEMTRLYCVEFNPASPYSLVVLGMY